MGYFAALAIGILVIIGCVTSSGAAAAVSSLASVRTYDVVIVGGGVVGCAIARRLSLTRATVALLEAASDVGEGASKGNSGIATCGAQTTPGTLESQLILASADAWEPLCTALDTPFERIGTLNLALTADEEARLPAMLAEARANGVAAEIVSGAQVQRLEPLVTPDVRAALHVPGDGIIDPIRLTIGYAELAARNDADIRRSTRVTGAHRDGGVTVLDDHHPVGARWVVNAAGVEADTVAAMAGGAALSSWPRLGQAWLLDRELGRHFRKIVGGIPDEVTRGVYVTPTTNRSVLVGPTARNHEDRGDRRTDADTLDGIMERGRRLVPSIAPTGRSRCSRRTARPAIRSTAWSGTRPSRTSSTRRRSARPASRPLRPSPSASATCSRRPGRRSSRTGPTRRWRCSPYRACSAIRARRSSSRSTRATAR